MAREVEELERASRWSGNDTQDDDFSDTAAAPFNKPVCQIRAHEILEIAKWAEDPLINSNCVIYQRGGSASIVLKKSSPVLGPIF
jgi:hypothetical protein